MAAEPGRLFTFPIPGKTAAELYLNNEGGADGFFPVGDNRCWHGGVHLTFGDAQPIVCVGNGELIAYRINKKPLPYEVERHVKELPGEKEYSNGFVLVRHEHKSAMGQDIVFYSLCMHLLPWDNLVAAALPKPDIFRKRYQALDVKSEDAVILAENDPASRLKKGVLPKGAYFVKLPVKQEGWTPKDSIKITKAGAEAARDISDLYSERPDSAGDETDLPASIKAGEAVKVLKKKGRHLQISYDDPSTSPLYRVLYQGEQTFTGYALLPKGFKASPISSRTDIPIQSATDKDVVVGRIRPSPYAHLTIKTSPWPPLPLPPVPPLPPGAPVPPLPVLPWYQTEPFDTAKYDGYAEVELELKAYKVGPNIYLPEAYGFADLENRAIFLNDPRYDPPHYKLIDDGLPVLKEAKPESEVAYMLPKDARITLKDPTDTLKDHAYNELVDGGFIFAHLTDDVSTGAKANIKVYAHNLTPEFDKVVQPKGVPVRMGDSIGYAGPYLFDTHRLHFEIFSDDKGFLSNPKKDKWGEPPILRVDKDAEFHTKSVGGGANPKIKVDWPGGSILRLLDDEASTSSKRNFKLQRVAMQGWVDAKLVDGQAPDALGRTGKTKVDVDHISLEEPSVAAAAPPLDVAFKIAKDTPVARCREGTPYGEAAFRVTVSKNADGWTEVGNVDLTKHTLKAGVDHIYSKKPGSAPGTPDVEVGPNGKVVAKPPAKGEKYILIDYTWPEEVDTQGWTDWLNIQEIPLTLDEVKAGKTQECTIIAKVDGLYTTPPDPPDIDPPDVATPIPAGTKGTIVTKPLRQYVLIGVNLDTSVEKTGWVRLTPSMRTVRSGPARSARYFTHAEFAPWTLDEGAYHTVDRSGISELLTNNPNPSPDYSAVAGKNSKELTLRPTDWSRWIEGNYDPPTPAKMGFIRIDDPKVTLLSPYDWPGWRSHDEPKKYSEDGFCDVPDLLGVIDATIDQDKDNVISDAEVAAVRDGKVKMRTIKEAVMDPNVANVLRRAACLHPTEWDTATDTEINKWERLSKAPYKLEGKPLEQTKAHIKNMQWWPAAAPAAKWPAGKTVWHFHPLGFIDNVRGILSAFTPDQLQKIAPKMAAAVATKYAPLLNRMMLMHQINTPLRQAHFLAQVLLETGELKYKTEGASGTDYDYRHDLGNYMPNDGPKFKGRGLLQVTGHVKYHFYGHQIGADLVGTPDDVANDDFLLCDSAGRYWVKGSAYGDLNKLADLDDFLTITRGVNGGYNHIELRLEYLVMAKALLMSG